MPKVIIWRDDAVEAEFDPAHRDWRIGRSETNDIALLDPRKSVSRFHAELREENGQWYFIDLNSQNGSWSDGQRVTRLQLRHDTEVSFGDYRLVFVDAPAAVVPPLVPDANTTATEGASAPPPEHPDQTLIMPSGRKDDVPTPPAGAPAVRAKASPAAKTRKGVNPVILVAFLLAMFGAVAAVGYRVYQSLSEPVETGTGSTAVPPPTPVPVTPTPTPVPVEADAAAEPAEEATAAKAEEPEPQKAAPRRVARRPAPPPTPRIPPEVEAQYDTGRRALAAQRFPEAIRAFERVMADLPDFRDTAALLAQARDGQQQAQTQALADGKRLEAAGEWGAAVSAYERADAGAEAAAARTKMHAAGDDAYRKARQFDARARAADAIGWYERAVDWLPASDPRRETARERLTQLKGGDE